MGSELIYVMAGEDTGQGENVPDLVRWLVIVFVPLAFVARLV